MIVLVGMDAAESTLVECWMDEGLLPNLARLRSRGAWGVLDSTSEVLNASVWPCFITGWDPERLGISNYMLWNPATLTMDRVNAEHLGVAPFWRRGGDRRFRSLALEVPYSFPIDETNGLELHGWAGHYGIVPRFAVPPSAIGPLEREFGGPPLDGYAPGHLSVRSYLRLRDKLVQATRAASNLATTLMQREPWDRADRRGGGPRRHLHDLLTARDGRPGQPRAHPAQDAPSSPGRRRAGRRRT